MKFHNLNKIGNLLDSFSPIYKIVIAKIIFDMFLFILISLIEKSDLAIYVLGLNGLLLTLYLIDVGKAQMSFMGIINFIFDKKR